MYLGQHLLKCFALC